MEKISSYRILKYLFYERFVLQNKIRKCFNFELRKEIAKSDSFWTNIPAGKSLLETTFTVFDLETTGFFPTLGDEIVSIGAIKMNVNEMKFSEHFYEVVTPIKKVPEHICTLTGLTKEQINNGKSFQEAYLNFLNFSKDTVLVAHPASFDVHFLKVLTKRWRIADFKPLFIDSYSMANLVRPQKNNKLDELVLHFNIEQQERHHALNDAQMTAEVFTKLLYLLREKEIHTLEDYYALSEKKKVIV